MAEATSGTDLTVIALDRPEAQALARLLAWNNMKGTLEDSLRSLLDAVGEVE